MTIGAVAATSSAASSPALNNRLPQQGGSDPVNDAADKIEKLLDSDGWNQWVSAGEVVEVNDILVKLDSKTADAVVDELDRRGLLDTLAHEMVDGSNVGGGVSNDNRRTMFANFAKMLDGNTLAKVEQAFAKESEGMKGVGWINELSSAIAQHSSSQTKLDFVKEMAPHANPDGWHETQTTGFGNVMTEKFKGDVEGLAIANVLGSMKDAGSYREQALSSLSADQFQSVVKAATRFETLTTSAGGATSFSNSFDTAAFVKLADTVAASSNISRKAEFIEFGGLALKDVRDSDNGIYVNTLDQDKAESTVRDALTKVMDSDTAGIVTELATQGDNKFGNGLASYAKSMLESGEEGRDKLAEQLNAIKYGNYGSGNVHDRLAQENSYGDRPVAAALGYFTGAVWAGAESISGDKQKQADLITDVLVTAVSLHPASAITAEGIKHLVNGAVQNDANLGDAMYQSVLPTDARGTISINADIQDTIHTRFSDVAEHAKP